MKALITIMLAILSFICADIADKMTKNVQKPQHIDTNPDCKGKTTIIAVIDTGFGAGYKGEETAKLCKYGHKNFVKDEYSTKFGTVDPVPVDHHGHGTHIAGTIDHYASLGNANYCLVILEYWSPLSLSDDNLKNTVKAIDYARQIHADYINYSSGGMEPNKDEISAVKKFLDSGGKFVAAAGNEHSDLANTPYYPAMDDDRVIVVGNLGLDKKKAPTSNFGTRVNYWQVGVSVKAYGVLMTGTSQASAITTGKLVGDIKNICK